MTRIDQSENSSTRIETPFFFCPRGAGHARFVDQGQSSCPLDRSWFSFPFVGDGSKGRVLGRRPTGVRPPCPAVPYATLALRANDQAAAMKALPDITTGYVHELVFSLFFLSSHLTFSTRMSVPDANTWHRPLIPIIFKSGGSTLI